MTTDLLFTLQLIDAVPSMKLTADLSHFLVAREFRIPLSDKDDALIQRILRRSWAYHGRVASREQIQLQLSFAHNQVWVERCSVGGGGRASSSSVSQTQNPPRSRSPQSWVRRSGTQ